MSIGTPASSSARITPRWAKPRGPPPPKHHADAAPGDAPGQPVDVRGRGRAGGGGGRRAPGAGRATGRCRSAAWSRRGGARGGAGRSSAPTARGPWAPGRRWPEPTRSTRSAWRRHRWVHSSWRPSPTYTITSWPLSTWSRWRATATSRRSPGVASQAPSPAAASTERGVDRGHGAEPLQRPRRGAR